MRALIDAWWPSVAGRETEAIVMTASGCGVTVKDYAHLLAKPTPTTAASRRADRGFSAKSSGLKTCPGEKPGPHRVPFTCTLPTPETSAAARQGGSLADPRRRTSPRCAPCCGSAGVLAAPAADRRRAARKLAALEEGAPQAIATANIGCLMHSDRDAGAPLDRADRRRTGVESPMAEVVRCLPAATVRIPARCSSRSRTASPPASGAIPRCPLAEGTLCTKVAHYLERTYAPDRLLYPQKRTGKKGEGKFRASRGMRRSTRSPPG